MVDMGSPASATRNGIGWFVRVEALIDLANFRSLDVETKMVWQVCVERVLSGLDMVKPGNYMGGLLSRFLIWGP